MAAAKASLPGLSTECVSQSRLLLTPLGVNPGVILARGLSNHWVIAHAPTPTPLCGFEHKNTKHVHAAYVRLPQLLRLSAHSRDSPE